VNATQYKATGSLSIKGKTANLQFPVDIKMDAGKSVFEGKVAVNRLFFNIGEGEWKDTALVADEVLIQFRVVGAIAPAGAKK
jgi:polyisoprenoid-binding protein YceI